MKEANHFALCFREFCNFSHNIVSIVNLEGYYSSGLMLKWEKEGIQKEFWWRNGRGKPICKPKKTWAYNSKMDRNYSKS
jgi:hypothetical protein